MRRPLMLAFALACPATLSAQFKPADVKHPRTLTVSSPMVPEQTIAILTAVLVERGYVVDRADATAVICAPREYKNAQLFTLRSNIVPALAGSSVVLSGSYDIPMLRVKDEPVEGNRPRLKGELWREMEAVAGALNDAVATNSSQ